jgi:hypothetical protein
VTRNIVVNSGFPAYIQNISTGSHQLLADEPPESGGADVGLTHTNWLWLAWAPAPA